MSENILVNVPGDFQEAVKDYLNAISESYYCRVGEEPNRAPFIKKIKKVFKGVPQEKKIYCLYFLLKSMTKSVGDGRLDEWRCELGNDLTEKLEKYI